MHGCCAARKPRSFVRVTRLRNSTCPTASAPCTWNTCFAISSPMVLTCSMDASFRDGLTPSPWHTDAVAGRPPHHVYEANTPKRPWHSVPNWPDHVTGDEMVAAMDKVGVDGAIFISAFSMYQYDASYAVEVQGSHPHRLAIVKPVDLDDPAVAEIIAELE